MPKEKPFFDRAGSQACGIQNLDPKKDARSPAVTVLPEGKLALAWREDVNGIYTAQLREFGR